MPKPCPRCGVENADAAERCRRCDAPLQRAAPISPAFRQFLRGLAGFAVITTIGVAALVYVHRTAVPLGDPVVPPIDTLAQEDAFAREQALDAPPPGTGPGNIPADGTHPGAAAGIPGPTASLPAPAPGTTTEPGTAPLPDPSDPILDEEDITDQMPEIPSGLEWNREILPPTRPAFPSDTAPMPPAADGEWSGMPMFPESNPLSSAPPMMEPGSEPAPGEPQAAWPDAGAGALPDPGQAPATSDGQQALAEASPPAPPASERPTRSLAAAQESQCANEGFLTRFVCHERVRLNYCENRWNRHPDCMLDSNASNY